MILSFFIISYKIWKKIYEKKSNVIKMIKKIIYF